MLWQAGVMKPGLETSSSGPEIRFEPQVINRISWGIGYRSPSWRQNTQPQLSKPHFCVFCCENPVGEARFAQPQGWKQGTWGPYLAPDSNISPPSANYKKKSSLYFDCCPRLSELHPVQQYPIVCLQDGHRNCFRVKPRGDSHRNSHRLQSSVSVADNLRANKTGGEVSHNLAGISERVKRKTWTPEQGADLLTAGSD